MLIQKHSKQYNNFKIFGLQYYCVFASYNLTFLFLLVFVPFHIVSKINMENQFVRTCIYMRTQYSNKFIVIAYLFLQAYFYIKHISLIIFITSQVLISKEYLQLEPIGLVFVFFFALILVIQFTAMLFHRFGTLSHILSSTELNWFCTKKVSFLLIIINKW